MAHDPTSRCDLERRPAERPRDRDRGDDRRLPRPADDVGVADRRAGGRDEPGGAAGRGPRLVLLDGLLERPGQGRHAADELDGQRRRSRPTSSRRAGRSSRPRSSSAASCRAPRGASFREAAEKAKDGCPISRALKGNVELSVEATLEG